MLKQLRIQNFAIIDQVEMEFGNGLNIISGETGAGKSIIMDALFLILGGRSSSDLIRRGADEATVEALFEIGQDKETHLVLENLGISAEDGDLIVRRIVQSSGKNRIFVNGSLVNMSTLNAITSQLVDLCSQHDQQLLAKPEEQLLWIDRFGKLDSERDKVRDLYLNWKKHQQALDKLSTDSSQRAQRIDFLRFQIQELEDANLNSSSEDQEIEQELKILGNAEHLFEFSSEAEGLIYGSDQSEGSPILDSVNNLLIKARSLVNSDPKLAEAVEFLSTLKVNTEELGFFLRQYGQKVSRDEGRLEDLNARHALLTKLKRKYGPMLEDVLLSLENFKKELSLLENHDSSLNEAREAVAHSRNELQRAAEKISKARARAAKDFASEVVNELADLNMDRARFEAQLSILEEPNAMGIDSIRFQIAANPGEPMGALNKVASGGELSRIMLAMHNVVSSLGGVGVFLFDEVDTGIGGKTAVTVGSKLQRVSKDNQVICITHLPQVAAFANQHFHVEKSVQKKNGEERTVCKVIPLSRDERVLEVARMLGGMGNDKAAMANAKAMIENAGSSVSAKTGKSTANSPAKKPEKSASKSKR